MGFVDYNYYVTTYGGSTIPESDFDGFERDAERDINYYTFGRLRGLSEPDEAVLMCICDVAEQICTRKSEFGDNPLESYSNDGLSGKFADNPSTQAFNQREQLTIAKWLADTGLLYKGLDYVY